MANTYRAIYETKILRGNVINYFTRRHGLTALRQNTSKPRPTFVYPENPDQTTATKARIDTALAGSKIRRIWHAITVSDEKDLKTKKHNKTITILNTENQQNRPFELCLRYEPNRISEEHLFELKIKSRKMRNNWKNSNRDRQIDKLEQLTDLVMS